MLQLRKLNGLLIGLTIEILHLYPGAGLIFLKSYLAISDEINYNILL